MEQDRENQIKANSVHVDDNFNTLVGAVNNKLDLDGTSTPTADIPFGGHKATNLGTPTVSADAATKGYVDTALTFKANTASPVFTGTPTAPTPATTDDSTQIATTAFVKAQGYAGATDVVHLTGDETIGGTKTFSSAAFGVASSVANSLLTTTAISRSGNGYVKFGNGLIIQWGGISGANPTVTLPTAMPSASYRVYVTNLYQYAGERNIQMYADNQTSTTFRIVNRGANNVANMWLAIGY
jgi:hypothetical protein